MKTVSLVMLAIVATVLLYLWQGTPSRSGDTAIEPATDAVDQRQPVPETGRGAELGKREASAANRAVLDISVHTVEALQVVFERAEQLAGEPGMHGGDASIVLVLHGPEVEFFATKNYATYRGIVDQAERLDSLDIIDVKVCQTMMRRFGIGQDEIPAFIEQVPLGPAEIDRLVGEGYVYF
jgi:intracellular sulfur oxidation DsrE/DsrF family protein